MSRQNNQEQELQEEEERCGCGHDHHEEEDHCGCGHEHHEHHEEEDHCGCGHEHQGLQEEEDHCGCGHEHQDHQEEEDHCECGHEHHEHHEEEDHCGCGHEHHEHHEEEDHCGCGHDHHEHHQEDGCCSDGCHCGENLAIRPEEEEEENDLPKILIGTGVFAVGLLADKLLGFEIPGIVLYLIAYLILGGEIILKSVKGILKGNLFDENFLMSIATIGALAIQEFPEAVGVMLFYRIGEWFEDRAVERSRNQIMDAIDMRPETVTVEKGGKVETIPAGRAEIGQIILVRPGERIPLDGVVVEGESRIDTSPVTGEPVPVAAGKGTTVLSGCMNTSGLLRIEITNTLETSMVTRILNSVEHAANNKPVMEKFITRFARVYTPFVVFLALATAIIPSLVTGDWYYWIYTALTFLVISCPCALVLSVPLAFFSAIGGGSKFGVLFKGGSAIEALGKVKAVVMDKTGTITKGNFVVQNCVPANGWSEENLLKICAEAELNSSHPIAVSLVTAAEEKNLKLEKPMKVEEIAGKGLKVQLSEGTVLCGNARLLEEHQVDIRAAAGDQHGTEVLVAVNGEYAGCLVIADTIKNDAAATMSYLKRLGIKTAMLTGDAAENAEYVGKELGIDLIYAKLLPEEKLSCLNKIREENGRVMFVGDGINDAPVLAGADVGAAMGSGADAAVEAADVVFMNSNMAAIPQAVDLSIRTGKVARQNVIFALVVKALIMVLGLAGFANMWAAVFADTGVAMICILNSVRLLYIKK